MDFAGPPFPKRFGRRPTRCRRPGRSCSDRCGAGRVDDLVVVGQIGQSLDGRIATATGHSHYINGPAGLAHLHRLRALVDAVVVGVGTALADDPQLTVRRVAGPQPGARRDRSARPAAGRAPGCSPPTACAAWWSPAPARAPPLPPDVEIVGAAADRRARSRRPRSFGALAERGLRRVLIEGGADTVSRFLAARCLDRLHVMVAPIILGSGRPSFALPPIDRVDQALRAPMQRASARRRGAVRLRSVGSARAGRAREQIDVTDADRRAAGGDQVAPARQPADHVGERHDRRSRARPRPSRTASRSGFRGPAGRTPSRTRPAPPNSRRARTARPRPRRRIGPSAGPKPLSVR